MIRLLTEALPILSLPVLAQSSLPEPTSPEAIGWILASAFAVVGMANQGVELWKKLHPTKTPPDHEVYATKEEVRLAVATAREEAAKEFKAHKQEILRVETDHRQTLQRIESRFETWLTDFDRETRGELDKKDARHATNQCSPRGCALKEGNSHKSLRMRRLESRDTKGLAPEEAGAGGGAGVEKRAR